MKKFGLLFCKFFGIEQAPVSHAERIASAIGGFIAILCIFVISQWFIGPSGNGILIASMGASAVLLFVVPHGQLSQPWAVLGGHVVSAIIGVACAQVISNEILAASTAVGLAIGGMYYLKCVHPPGGATALSAVLGGEATQALGYQFVFTPVLMNVVIMLTIAILYNFLFSWRRYPAYLQKSIVDPGNNSEVSEQDEISHSDFLYALRQVDSFVDASEYDILRVYELAKSQSRSRHINANEITLGSYYSNGEYGDTWSVRQVVDESPNIDAEKDMIVYKVIAGQGRRTSGCITRTEFTRWAKHQVIRDEENWKRAGPDQ